MRTIKFRGKRCDNGEWVYGHYLESTKTWHGCHPHKAWILTDAMTNGGFFALLGRHAVINESVGQFTGLYDKNGEEVYEGDILLWTRKNVHIEGRPLQDFADRCVIFYDDDKRAFRFRYKLDCGSCSGLLNFSDDRADESYIEIIGNIHDNPELLKKGGL